ncbi:MAG: sensor histidine kinase [Acidimicrobiia bacterium]
MARADDVSAVEPIETVLLWIVLAFRILGWLWLALLGIAALVTESDANTTIVTVMVVGTAAWTLLTIWLAKTPGCRIKSPAFVIADGVVAVLVANASYFADAASNLHGGYPISWIAVVAYAANVRWALGAGAILFVNQWVGMEIEGSRNLTDQLGAVVFLVYGAIVGFGFDLIRERDALRRAAEAEVAEARLRQTRQADQAALADQLHDSVLQSLQAIRMNPSDAEQVTRVARQQERELRKTITTLKSNHDHPLAVALLGMRDDVERMYPIEVKIVCTHDADMTPTLAALVEATREAVINAAKHSGASEVVVAITNDSTTVTSFIRDQGEGFDSEGIGDGFGVENSIVARIESVGGAASIQSAPNAGTIVEITVPTKEEHND